MKKVLFITILSLFMNMFGQSESDNKSNANAKISTKNLSQVMGLSKVESDKVYQLSIEHCIMSHFKIN
jgi:hypothetical protein